MKGFIRRRNVRELCLAASICFGGVALSVQGVPLEQGNICHSMFGRENSPFQSAFRDVDPAPYLDMCIIETNPCMVAAAYVQAAKRLEIHIGPPSACMP